MNLNKYFNKLKFTDNKGGYIVLINNMFELFVETYKKKEGLGRE